MRFTCYVCNRQVSSNFVHCALCNNVAHCKCVGTPTPTDWFCHSCTRDSLPFSDLDMVEFECTFNLDIPFEMYDLYGKCNDLNFTPFNYTELKNDYDADIDPDNNLV